jgi:hypothetical protein
MLYGLSQQSANTSIATCALEIRAAQTNEPRIVELAISQLSAPAAFATYGLGRPGSIGVTPTSPAAFVAESSVAGGANSVSTAATAWGTAPTVPTNFNRRISCNTTVGVGVVWTFPRGLDIALGQSVVVWLITAGVLLNIWTMIDE